MRIIVRARVFTDDGEGEELSMKTSAAVIGERFTADLGTLRTDRERPEARRRL
ncbi:MAG: hypothetical protein ACJ77Q_08145 [Gemmatimonadaceae bacterium]